MRRAIVVAACVLAACSEPVDPTEVAPAGAGTVNDATRDAFARPLLTLTDDERGNFSAGDHLFGANWVTAPASTTARDGLGPTYNALACADCHFRDGRGRLPSMPGDGLHSALVRLSVVDAQGQSVPEPNYGDQLQPHGVLEVPGEVRIAVHFETSTSTYPDGTSHELRRPVLDIDELAFGPFAEGTQLSLRVAPAQIGLGLLETIPEADLRALADPDDRDGDGVSGRLRTTTDLATGQPAIGRFGWKAGQPNLRQQVAAAFLGDIGLTSRLFPEQNCPSVQVDCLAAPNGDGPDGFEISDTILDLVTIYNRALSVPRRRTAEDPQVLEGRSRFREAGCANCHVPTFVTGSTDIASLSAQRIHPYTDLLLHDMGEDLADHRPEGDASGTEWRTPPLWGLSRLETVSGHMDLLHDGRARGVEEAILWHGGEATRARDAFRSLDAEARAALIAFVGSL